MFELIRNHIEYDTFKQELEPHFNDEYQKADISVLDIIVGQPDGDIPLQDSNLLHYHERAVHFPLTQSFVIAVEKEFQGDLARVHYLTIYPRCELTEHNTGQYYENKDRFITVLQGSATSDDGKHKLQEGEMWWIDLGTPYNLLNNKKKNFIGLVFDLQNSDWTTQWT